MAEWKQKYSEDYLLKYFGKRIVAKLISINPRRETIGIGTWAKIDYLVNHKGYKVFIERG